MLLVKVAHLPLDVGAVHREVLVEAVSRLDDGVHNRLSVVAVHAQADGARPIICDVEIERRPAGVAAGAGPPLQSRRNKYIEEALHFILMARNLAGIRNQGLWSIKSESISLAGHKTQFQHHKLIA